MSNVYVVVNKSNGEPASRTAVFSRQEARDLKNTIASRRSISTRSLKIVRYSPDSVVR